MKLSPKGEFAHPTCAHITILYVCFDLNARLGKSEIGSSLFLKFCVENGVDSLQYIASRISEVFLTVHDIHCSQTHTTYLHCMVLDISHTTHSMLEGLSNDKHYPSYEAHVLLSFETKRKWNSYLFISEKFFCC